MLQPSFVPYAFNFLFALNAVSLYDSCTKFSAFETILFHDSLRILCPSQHLQESDCFEHSRALFAGWREQDFTVNCQGLLAKSIGLQRERRWVPRESPLECFRFPSPAHKSQLASKSNLSAGPLIQHCCPHLLSW